MSKNVAEDARIIRSYSPPGDWESGFYPVGNGRLGASLGSNATTDIIQLNEDSLWGGLPDYDNTTARVAEDLLDGSVTGFGSFMSVGRLVVDIEGAGASLDRSLDVSTGVASVNSTVEQASGGSVSTNRSLFASAPADAIVYSLRSEGLSKTQLRLELDQPGFIRSGEAGVLLEAGGTLANGLAFALRVREIKADYAQHTTHSMVDALTQGVLRDERDLAIRGCQLPAEHLVYTSRSSDQVYATSRTIEFSELSELTLAIDIATNYNLHAAQIDTSIDPWHTLDARYRELLNGIWEGIDQNEIKDPLAALQIRHEAELASILGTMTIGLGSSEEEATGSEQAANAIATPPSTRERIERYQSGISDPALEILVFNFGRYLLASCSRPGTLPANLQGVWCSQITPPWCSDYHSNINLQMNYWGAEATGLADLHEPLFDFLSAGAPAWERASRLEFGSGVQGWTCRTSQNIFGGHAWEWNTVASAWYATHAIDHWKFSATPTETAQKVWQLVEGACGFWLGRLVEGEDTVSFVRDGKLVEGRELLSPAGWSPEHGPREDGVSYDQQILRELFTGAVEMGTALGKPEALINEYTEIRDRLGKDRIGSWGQLQEWREDRDDPQNVHRHTSHLFAVYPGSTITQETPELLAAAEVSLRARCSAREGEVSSQKVTGDSVRSWTWPWRAALFARLGDADASYQMLHGLISRSTLDNLFATHPPFQIDGNLGMVGAIAEMLIQSHESVIKVLPALPREWSQSGYAYGLRARGGFTVDVEWERGQVSRLRVTDLRSEGSRSPVVLVEGKELTPVSGEWISF